jgi:holo-[acyl-carrier protein] synthase
MIEGIGIDMIEVERVGSRIDRENGFRELVFSPGEIAYCESKTHKHQHYSARFAAKEAFFKALGTGWAQGTSFNEIEILPGEKGEPHLHLSGNTAVTLAHLKGCVIKVSLTHLKDIAAAVVVISIK